MIEHNIDISCFTTSDIYLFTMLYSTTVASDYMKPVHIVSLISVIISAIKDISDADDKTY